MASLFKNITTYDLIFFLLNADGEEERDELTLRWKDNKLQELNFLGIVVRSAKHESLYRSLHPGVFQP
jgi:hypothetical protein